MTKAEKNQLIDELVDTLSASGTVYLTDTSELNAEVTSELRRTCFNRNIKMTVVKNTLLMKAFERVEGKDYSELYGSLKGSTSLMMAESSSAPARLIKEFRRKHAKPVLKAAYVEEMCFVGDNQIDTLINIKTREELIGDIVALLQSPIRNVVGALQSGGHTVAGLVKTLSER
jgi:large subunit ribosomal protein L10